MRQDFSRQREAAVDALKAEGILRSPSVIRAMLTVPREEFLPNDVKQYAYADTPLPIGYGQTTSALHMTAIFCEYGELKVGQKVLEVGAGCGYMSCVFAEVVAPSGLPNEKWGHVWTVEIVEELAEAARRNLERAGYSDRVTAVHGDGSIGLKGSSPYDVIIVTSAAPDVPEELVEQLRPNGILLIPVGGIHFYQELLRIRRHPDGTTSRQNLGGVAFVPMRGKAGWKS